jgi:hypothetical protein
MCVVYGFNIEYPNGMEVYLYSSDTKCSFFYFFVSVDCHNKIINRRKWMKYFFDHLWRRIFVCDSYLNQLALVMTYSWWVNRGSPSPSTDLVFSALCSVVTHRAEDEFFAFCISIRTLLSCDWIHKWWGDRSISRKAIRCSLHESQARKFSARQCIFVFCCD